MNDWVQLAACKGKGDLFFSFKEDEIQEALGICSGCPVIYECFDSADQNDFNDSVRAGFRPGSFKGAPVREKDWGMVINKTQCSRGHDTTFEGARNASGNCRVCMKVKSAESRTKDHSHRYGSFCKRGHEINENNITKGGSCAECMRASARRSYQRKMGRIVVE